MTIRAMGFPGRYLQGPGASAEIPALLAEFGVRAPAIVADAVVSDALLGPLSQRLQAAGLAVHPLHFPGECTAATIAELAATFRAAGADSVVALGGGKTIDTSKGIAKACGVPLVVAPSIASNDSPTSRLIVLYDEAHRVAGVELMRRNPDAVVVDTNFVVQAPVRFFRAGIGDALSKRFEAGQCAVAPDARNFFGTRPPRTAGLLADRCYDVIRGHGAEALADVAAHRTTEAVETVVEATVLLSGLGFESGGLSLAHALLRGFSAIPAMAGALHGEMVAYGTIVQLCAEQRPADEIAEFAGFVASLGLPVRLADLGWAAPDDAGLRLIAERTCAAPYIGHFQRPLDADAVRGAILEAESVGRE
ncbi:glycerol dehydrogenase [Azospirillum sp.]|uniref:glycerol dehydrogenase n=1 Tax=Azospirillum sp. TaxID=34012 RepID=UPI002D3078DC|nr:glycerol dehydrogenase [Azospirillum sp.]HYD67069.1 glycerol dehydrogenase [Azospirillum sp.]